jgi:O-antigen/teichoic acid export membrane protein
VAGSARSESLKEPGEGAQGLGRRTALNAGSAVLSQLAGKGATLAWTLFAARKLSQQDFGGFFFAMSTALLVCALVKWGFDARIIQMGSREPHRLTEFFTVSVAWQTILALPICSIAVAVCWASRPSPAAKFALVFVTLSVALDSCGDTCRAAAAGAQNQHYAALALICQRFLTAGFVVAVLQFGGGLYGMSVAALAGSSLGLMAHVRALRPIGISLRPRRLRAPEMWVYARASWMLGVSSVVLMALFRVDSVMLGVLKGDQAVAAYAAVYKLLETVLFLVFALQTAILPVMSVARDERTIKHEFSRALTAVSLIYMPFAAVCFVKASNVLLLLYGERYVSSSAVILRWLALAPLLYAVPLLGNSALLALDRAADMLRGAIIATAANVVANIILIPALSGTGAAITTTASYAVNGVIVVLFLRHRGVRMHIVRWMAEPAAAAAVLVWFLTATSWPLVPSVLLGYALFLLVWLVLARCFSPEQLRILTALAPRTTRL